ncbi:MAG: hypothetical protein ACI4HI_09410 [Lachnospiraceae bacterium]
MEKNETELDIDAFFKELERIYYREGVLAIEAYGMEYLEGTYLDFWRWIYEASVEDYQRDEILTQIACYAKTDLVRRNKQKIYKAVELADTYTFSLQKTGLSFCSQKPSITYDERAKVLEKQQEMEMEAEVKKLKDFSDSFTQFSRATTSGAWFQNSSSKKRQYFLTQIDDRELTAIFFLYTPYQRNCILEEMSIRMQHMVLQLMKIMVEEKEFPVEEWISIERNVTAKIEKYKEELDAIE